MLSGQQNSFHWFDRLVKSNDVKLKWQRHRCHPFSQFFCNVLKQYFIAFFNSWRYESVSNQSLIKFFLVLTFLRSWGHQKCEKDNRYPKKLFLDYFYCKEIFRQTEIGRKHTHDSSRRKDSCHQKVPPSSSVKTYFQ